MQVLSKNSTMTDRLSFRAKKIHQSFAKSLSEIFQNTNSAQNLSDEKLSLKCTKPDNRKIRRIYSQGILTILPQAENNFFKTFQVLLEKSQKPGRALAIFYVLIEMAKSTRKERQAKTLNMMLLIIARNKIVFFIL